MKNVLAAVTFCAVATAASAQAPTPARQPWEWTDAERIAERTNPDRIRERVADAEVDILARGTKPGSYLLGDSIDGNKHPELFLPIELFQMMVHSTFTGPANAKEHWRRSVEKRSQQALPANFWGRLTEAVTPYVNTAMAARELIDRASATSGDAKKQLNDQAQRIQAGQCRALHDALEAARAEFGKPFFDRLLYETIPQGSGSSFATAPTTAQLTFLLSGCQ